MKTKLAIFDLDGTLFDTKEVNFNAYNQAIIDSGLKNVRFDYKYYCEFCNGNNYKVFLPKIIKNITDEQLNNIHERKKLYYTKYLSKARKNESLFSIIESIKERYYIVLSTVASRKNSYDILEAFDVLEKFDLIITKEDVKNTKPSPECFLKAMDYFKITSDDTIIFEDSKTGLEAASKSKANVVKVLGFN